METQIKDNSLTQGLIQPPTREELGAFVIESNTLAKRSPECYVCKQDIKSYG